MFSNQNFDLVTSAVTRAVPALSRHRAQTLEGTAGNILKHRKEYKPCNLLKKKKHGAIKQ